MQLLLSPIDITIILLCILASVGIGVFFSGRQTSMNSFFLGSKGMSGWLLGFSMTGTMISAMSFLASPGYAFAEDFRYVYPGFVMIFTGFLAMYFIVPLFRKVNTPSGYEYLEKRFGPWARLYMAFGYLAFNVMRLGVVLYAASLALHVVLGVDILTVMLVLGIVSTFYTMLGGFEAVIWSELLQVVILFAGAAVLVPMALNLVDGGFLKVVEMGWESGKFSPGSLEFSFMEKTVWMMMISACFSTLAEYGTRQDFIQRYRAAKSLNHARLAIFVGAVTIVPTWIYFNFLGTSLWAYYEINPDGYVAQMLLRGTPEEIVPYFIATQVPNGLRGLVMGGILMATLSTLAPMINACSVTFMGDFYQNYIHKKGDARHYLKASRVCTVLMGVLMFVVALLINSWRNNTLQDFSNILALVLSAGMMGLFFVGFFSTRVSSKAAFTAMAVTVALMVTWLMLSSPTVQAAHPGLESWVPNLLWACVFSNGFFIVFVLLIARFFPKPARDLSDVTWKGVQAQIKKGQD